MTGCSTYMMNIGTTKCFEFRTLRISCELLEREFFRHHRYLVDQLHQVRRLKYYLKYEADYKKIDSATKIKDGLVKLMHILEYFEDLFEDMCNRERRAAKSLLRCMKYFEKAECSKNERESYEERRFQRVIIDYLAGSGYLKTAKKWASRTVNISLCHLFIYDEQKKVTESIKKHKIEELLNWVKINRTRLRQFKGDLEIETHMQKIIVMSKEGRKMEAIKYVRTHFRKMLKAFSKQALIRLMGFIGFGLATGPDYIDFLSQKRWDFLQFRFRQEWGKLYQVDSTKLFNACFCIGAASLRSPYCKPDNNAQCVACLPPIHSETHDLPYAHALRSMLKCRHCQRIMHNNNPPFLVPEGYCYCLKCIQQFRKNTILFFPETRKIYLMSKLLPVSLTV